MLNRQYTTNLRMRTSVTLTICFIMIAISITTDLIPGIFFNSALAQSIHSTDNLNNEAKINIAEQQIMLNKQNLTAIPKPIPKPELNMPMKAVNRVGTAFSGRRSVSIKSTDAGIVPRYPQTSACINCGTVDFVNIIGQGNNIDFITGGIISGIIRNKIIGHGQHQHYPPNTTMNENSHANHQHGNQSTNNTARYEVGVTMDDGTQTILKQQHAPQFHFGDRVRLIDGVILPNQ